MVFIQVWNLCSTQIPLKVTCISQVSPVSSDSLSKDGKPHWNIICLENPTGLSCQLRPDGAFHPHHQDQTYFTGLMILNASFTTAYKIVQLGIFMTFKSIHVLLFKKKNRACTLYLKNSYKLLFYMLPWLMS